MKIKKRLIYLYERAYHNMYFYMHLSCFVPGKFLSEFRSAIGSLYENLINQASLKQIYSCMHRHLCEPRCPSPGCLEGKCCSPGVHADRWYSNRFRVAPVSRRPGQPALIPCCEHPAHGRYKKMLNYICLVLMMIFLVSGSACPSFAKTGYVSDMLILTVRSGPGKNFEVLKTLKSNDSVEIFEKQNKYYRIKTADGTEGWVEQQYITDQTPQAIVADKLKKKILSIQENNKKLSMDNAAMKEKIKTMEQDFQIKISALNASLENAIQGNQKLKADLYKVENKYKDFIKKSGNPAQIISENKKLKQENISLSLQIKKLTANNGHYFKEGMIKWFLAGAGVLVIGWLIGISIKGRKRSGRLLGLFI